MILCKSFLPVIHVLAGAVNQICAFEDRSTRHVIEKSDAMIQQAFAQLLVCMIRQNFFTEINGCYFSQRCGNIQPRVQKNCSEAVQVKLFRFIIEFISQMQAQCFQRLSVLFCMLLERVLHPFTGCEQVARALVHTSPFPARG